MIEANIPRDLSDAELNQCREYAQAHKRDFISYTQALNWFIQGAVNSKIQSFNNRGD